MKRTRINPISNKRKKVLQKEAEIRNQLLTKFGGRCMICGKPPDWRGLSLHHIEFKSKGGDNSEGNVLLVCGVCHSAFHGIREVIKWT